MGQALDHVKISHALSKQDILALGEHVTKDFIDRVMDHKKIDHNTVIQIAESNIGFAIREWLGRVSGLSDGGPDL